MWKKESQVVIFLQNFESVDKGNCETYFKQKVRREMVCYLGEIKCLIKELGGT